MMHNWAGPGSGFISQGNFWWMGPVSMIINILIVAVIIFIVVKLVNKYLMRTENTRGKEDPAMVILRQRYAKGEIDTEEFNKKKADLE